MTTTFFYPGQTSSSKNSVHGHCRVRQILLSALFFLFSYALPEIAKATDVRVAFGDSISPYAIEKTSNGIELDIIREALRRKGYTLVPVFMPFARLGSAFANEQVDAVATINSDSGIKAVFSKVHIEYQNVAVTLEARHLTINSIDDLKGLRVVGFRAATTYLGDAFRQFTHNNPHYTEESHQIGQNRLLYNDGADVIVEDRIIFTNIDHTLIDSKFSERPQPVVFHPLFKSTKYQVGFRDAAICDKFNEGLSSLSNADIKAIYDRYNASMPPVEKTTVYVTQVK